MFGFARKIDAETQEQAKFYAGLAKDSVNRGNTDAAWHFLTEAYHLAGQAGDNAMAIECRNARNTLSKPKDARLAPDWGFAGLLLLLFG